MTWRTRWLLAMLGACSTTPPPSSSTPGVVNGTIRDTHLAVAAALALPDHDELHIVLSSEADLCGATVKHPGETALGFILSAATPGTYQVRADAPPYALALATILDAQCMDNTDISAQVDTGSVTLTKVDGGVFSGSFDVTLGADHVTGEFRAVECDITPPQTPLPCVP